MSAKISLYKNCYGAKEERSLELNEFLDLIKNGYWESDVNKIRDAIDVVQQKELKNQQPAVTISGWFPDGKKNENMVTHSGYLCVDIDNLYDEDKLESLKYSVFNLPYVKAVFKSVRGKGLAIIVKIDPDKHAQSFLQIDRIFRNDFQTTIDQSCKNVSRTRIISSDKSALIKLDSAVTMFKVVASITKEIQRPEKEKFFCSDDDLKYIIDQITRDRVDITGDYNQWVQLCFACWDFGNVEGKDIFHKISSISSEYSFDKCEKQWNECRVHDGSVTRNTFYYFCKQYGIKTISNKTTDIVNTVKIGKLREKRLDAIKEDVSKKYELTPSVETLIKNVNNSVVSEEDLHVTEVMSIWLNKNYEGKMRYDDVLRQIWFDDILLTDFDVNSLYMDFCKAYPKLKGTSKDNFYTVLNSRTIERFNPFDDYFDSLNAEKTGAWEEFCGYIDFEKPEGHYFLKKWMLGIIFSVKVDYSILMFILVGGQGIGKTEFFRALFPKKLEPYFSDNGFTDGNDGEIEMTTKLLIVDDEFEGKGLKDTRHMKKKLSKKNVNKRSPYGRLQEQRRRYAVYGGCCNEDNILADTTGNRRLLPFRVTGIDHEAIKNMDINRLWGELLYEFNQNHKWFMLSADDILLLKRKTESMKTIVYEEEAFIVCFEKGNDPYLLSDIVRILEENTPVKVKLSAQRLANIMTSIGIEKKRISVKDYNSESRPNVWLLNRKKWTDKPVLSYDNEDGTEVINIDPNTVDPQELPF